MTETGPNEKPTPKPRTNRSRASTPESATPKTMTPRTTTRKAATPKSAPTKPTQAPPVSVEAETKSGMSKFARAMVIACVAAVVGAVVTVWLTRSLDQAAPASVPAPIATPTAVEAFRSDDPFDVEIFTDRGYDFALPGLLDDPADFGPLMAGDYDRVGLTEFAEGLGGQRIGGHFVKIFVTARPDHPVSIVSVTPLITDVRPPLNGTLITKERGGTGGDPWLSSDLDDPEHVLRDEEGDPYFEKTTVVVASEQSQAFHIYFHTDQSSTNGSSRSACSDPTALSRRC